MFIKVSFVKVNLRKSICEGRFVKNEICGSQLWKPICESPLMHVNLWNVKRKSRIVISKTGTVYMWKLSSEKTNYCSEIRRANVKSVKVNRWKSNRERQSVKSNRERQSVNVNACFFWTPALTSRGGRPTHLCSRTVSNRRRPICESQYVKGVFDGTGMPGTGMDVVPKLPKCPVPVLTSYRSYRSARYRY